MLIVNLQYARETESILAQQRKENRSNMFTLCPHVQVSTTTTPTTTTSSITLSGCLTDVFVCS